MDQTVSNAMSASEASGDAVLIRSANLDWSNQGGLVDIVWRDGVVVQIANAGDLPGRAVRSVGAIVDAEGAAVIPGLHDHHLHLMALAAARASVRVGPPEVVDAAGLAEVLSREVDAAAGAWVRAVGYHDSVAGHLDAAILDRLVPAATRTPIRVQHRGGQVWVLNHWAMEVIDLDGVDHPGVDRGASGAPTGRLIGLDDALRERIPQVSVDLAAVGDELAGYGVTGVSDLTPTESSDEVDALAAVVTRSAFPLRVMITGGPGLGSFGGLDVGPVKFLPIDHRLPDVETLATGIAAAHRSGRCAAVHCVSRAGLVIALAAWAAAGVREGDRIEHGAVIPAELIPEIRDLGLIVVTQPNFVAERGDRYLAEVDDDDLAHLWRCASLMASGVDVVGGTDAPFGDPDPWRAVAAAIERRVRTGVVLGADERLDADRALALFWGRPDRPTDRRRIRPGSVTDLCVLDAPLGDVLTAVVADPTTPRVRATLGRSGLVERHR